MIASTIRSNPRCKGRGRWARRAALRVLRLRGSVLASNRLIRELIRLRICDLEEQAPVVGGLGGTTSLLPGAAVRRTCSLFWLLAEPATKAGSYLRSASRNSRALFLSASYASGASKC